MPPGAARNALDCAIWDLEAKQHGKRAWELAGLAEPEGLTTAFTLSLDTPENMHHAASKNADRPLLKLKLGGQDDLERLEAVRRGAPDADIIVDANEAWDAPTWLALQNPLKQLGVSLIEQPLVEGEDLALLENMSDLMPVCADESCHLYRTTLKSLPDATISSTSNSTRRGGLTEALKLRIAKPGSIGIWCHGGLYGRVVTCNGACDCWWLKDAEYTDLDGPLLLAEDRREKLEYQGSIVFPAKSELWG